MTRNVVVIGGGIVGTALAAALIQCRGVAVTVLERAPAGRLLGSTGHAPGFVGLLGETAVATDLARSSADVYERLQHDGRPGLDRVGGLEVATTAAAMTDLMRRAELANDAGLPTRVLDPALAAARAPDLVSPDRCVGGVLHRLDGTARADVITTALQLRAAQGRGARFVYEAPVDAVETTAGRVRAVRTPADTFRADDVVVAAGIWGNAVLASLGLRLPLVPVAHPYVYGPERAVASTPTPFVRWPEHHVYARDHGRRLGLGTYDHAPVPVAVDQLGAEAEQPWPGPLFDDAVDRAMDLLPVPFTPECRLNGVFAMTADNLPLLGPVEAVPGLWVAEAIWITHAAGAARALAEMITDTPSSLSGLDVLHPGRFGGRDPADLTASALRLYRDIYSTA